MKAPGARGGEVVKLEVVVEVDDSGQAEAVCVVGGIEGHGCGELASRPACHFQGHRLPYATSHLNFVCNLLKLADLKDVAI